MSLSQQELQQWENLLNSLKVSDLGSLMQLMNGNRMGKKAELIQRAVGYLRNPNTQSRLVQWLREQHRPYPRPAQPQRTQPPIMQGGYHNSASNGTSSFNAYNGSMAATSFPGAIKKLHGLKAVPLPFYDSCEPCMDPIELPATPTHQKINSKQTMSLIIPQNRLSAVTYRSDISPLPRYEVQLRFFLLPDNYLTTEQPDEFPLNCQVKVDEHLIQLPPIVPTNRPNVEAKRPSRPVNLTPTLQNLGIGARSYKLTVDWTADKRRWGVTVGVVYRTNTAMLLKRTEDRAEAKQALEVTKNIIIRRLGTGDDDGIAMEQLKTSLRCPLLRTRMAIPVRCRDCTHLQCYDLFNYLLMNEKRPTWKCPVCSNPAPYNRLIIDQYFVKVIQEVPTNVEEVELLRDGSWKIIKEESDDDLSGDDVKPTIKKAENGKRPADDGDGTGPQAKKKPVDDEVITLDDSDDEDTQIAVANSLADKCRVNGDANRQFTKLTTPPHNRIEVITLEDTPPRQQATSDASTSCSAPISNSTLRPLATLPMSASWRSIGSSGATPSPGLSSNPSPIMTNTLGAAAPPGPGSMMPNNSLGPAAYQNLNVFPSYNATSLNSYQNYANGYQRPGQHMQYNPYDPPMSDQLQRVLTESDALINLQNRRP